MPGSHANHVFEGADNEQFAQHIEESVTQLGECEHSHWGNGHCIEALLSLFIAVMIIMYIKLTWILLLSIPAVLAIKTEHIQSYFK